MHILSTSVETYIYCRPHIFLLLFFSLHLRPAACLEAYVPQQQRIISSLCLHGFPCWVFGWSQAQSHRGVLQTHGLPSPGVRARVWDGNKAGIWCMKYGIWCPCLSSLFLCISESNLGREDQEEKVGTPRGERMAILSSGRAWFPMSRGKSC